MMIKIWEIKIIYSKNIRKIKVPKIQCKILKNKIIWLLINLVNPKVL